MWLMRQRRQDDEGVRYHAYLQCPRPYAAGRVCVNLCPMMKSSECARPSGFNMHRLAEIEHRYDRTNLFRMNQNVAAD
jgi:hypothetical protein